MTERDKVNELINKMYNVSMGITYIDALDAASNVVDEILSEYKKMKFEYTGTQAETYVQDNIDYWLRVSDIIVAEKKEIIKYRNHKKVDKTTKPE